MSAPVRMFGAELRAPKQCVSGTHRTRTPEQTLAAWRPLMRQFGITRLADVTGLDHVGIPVVVAVRPRATALATSQGKGLRLEDAMASALMEAIEIWHAENLDAPVRYATYDELRRRHRVIDVSRLELVRERGSIPTLPSLWIEGWDLISEEPKWVPLECVGLHTRPYPSQFAQLDTNGLASGNHLLEALCHGLCEVIERDALTGLLFDAAHRRVDLERVEHAPCRHLLDALCAAGLTVDAQAITSDVGVATFAVRVFDRAEQHNLRPMFMGGGSGTHLSPPIALLRALTEAVQDRLGRISGARDDITRSAYEAILDQAEQMALRDAVASAPVECLLEQLPEHATDSFEGDTKVLVEALRTAGTSEVVVVDLSRADVGIPVVRVVAPMLENAFGKRIPPSGSRWAERTRRPR